MASKPTQDHSSQEQDSVSRLEGSQKKEGSIGYFLSIHATERNVEPIKEKEMLAYV